MSETPKKPDADGRARTRHRRILGWAAAAIPALLIATVAVLFTVNLGFLRPQVERMLSERAGREFRIDGDFDLRIGRETVIVAEGVSLANAAWADRPAVLEIGRIEIRLDARSVLAGPIRVRRLDIDDANLFLSRSEDGESNWMLDDAPPPDRDSARPGSDAGILFEQLDVDRARLVYQDAGRDQRLELDVESLQQRRRADDYLEFSAAGTLGGRSISASGQVGTWTALLRQTDVAFDVTADLDTVHVEAGGRLDELSRLHRPSLHFSLAGPDIDDLTRMLGVGDDGLGDIGLTGSLLPVDDGPLVLSVLGNVGSNDIEATGRLSDLRGLDEIDIVVDAAGPDLARILRWFGIDRIREGPFSLSVDASRRGPRLDVERANMRFGEAEFDLTAALPNFPGLDDGRIDLDISGPDIERFRHLTDLPGTAVGAFEASFGLDVSPTGEQSFEGAIETSLLEAEASGRLGPAPDYLGSRIRFDVGATSLAEIGAGRGITALPDSPVDLSGVVELSGDGLRTIGPVVVGLGEDSARLEGAFAPRPGLVGTRLDFDVAGADLANSVTGFVAVNGVPSEAFSLAGQLEIRDGDLRFRDVSGTLGSSAVNIDGKLSTRPFVIGSRFEVDASGPAFEELIDAPGGVMLVPGAYELSGAVAVGEDLLVFEGARLERGRGSIAGDLRLGLPVSRRHVDFDLRGRGADIRELLRGFEAFEADPAAFALDAAGTLRGREWTFERLEATVGDASASASGVLGLGEGAAATRLAFEGDIPSLSRLGTIAGNRPRERGLRWRGVVTGGADFVEIENLAAELGDSDVRGRIVYRFGGVPELDVDVFADSIEVAPFMQEPPGNDDPQPDFEDGRLIPDVRIPFGPMARLNASLDIAVGAFRRERLDLRNLNVVASLQDGVLDVSRLSFEPPAGRFEGRLRLDPAGGSGRAELEVVARRFALGAREMNEDLSMTADIDLKLEATGTDLRGLLANADGAMLIDNRGGRIVNNRFLQTFYGDLLREVLTTVNPFARSNPVTELDCVVLPYLIDDGTIRQRPNSLFRTAKLQIASQGSIDLETEALDIAFRTSPRAGLTISAGELVNPFVRVVGTLARPRLAVDEQGVLITGGAAVATGGLSIVARAVWDRLRRSPDPCGEILEQAHELLGERLPDWRDSVSAESGE